MARNNNTPVPPKPPKSQVTQIPVQVEEKPNLEQADNPLTTANSNNDEAKITVRTIGVPSGRRFRAGIEFTSTPREIDLSTLNDQQRSAIESDPYLKID